MKTKLEGVSTQTTLLLCLTKGLVLLPRQKHTKVTAGSYHSKFPYTTAYR